jgi:TnpA family transposase
VQAVTVMESKTTIQPDYLSGDTHSINRANFVLLLLLSCTFIPHIKNIKEQAEKLGCFEDPSLYQGYLLVPKDRFKEQLIEEEWADLQHIFASLLMKHTSHNVIVKKLSSMKKSHKICKALEEYNKILHDKHILRCVDNPSFRKGIRTSLNRGEGYHQLEGKIMSLNDNKLRGSTELELAISNECIRLVANCIIYYNTYLLSELYRIHEDLGHKEVLEFIQRLSPIAWRHINLNGRYEFLTLIEIFDLNTTLTNLVFEDKESYTKS